jgi:hypothetical protein
MKKLRGVRKRGIKRKTKKEETPLNGKEREGDREEENERHREREKPERERERDGLSLF